MIKIILTVGHKLPFTYSNFMRWSERIEFKGISDFIRLPLELWHCWLGIRKSIWPVKNWVMRWWHGYLSGMRCKWFAYGPADATATLLSLALLKFRMIFTFLVLTYPGCPGKEATKWVFVFWFHQKLEVMEKVAISEYFHGDGKKHIV